MSKFSEAPKLVLIAWVTSLLATLASIYFIEVSGNAAAPLCWFERMLIFSVFITLSVGIARSDNNVRYYLAPLVILGTISAAFQQLVHWGLITSSSGTCSTGFICTVKFFNAFGFVTQATLCLGAFLLIGSCVLRLNRS